MSSRLTTRAAAAVLLLSALPGCFITRAVGITSPDPDVAQSGDTAETLYAKAERAFAAKDWSLANDLFGKVWRDFPNSPLAADARFYEAESRYGMEKWNGSFELYKSYLKAQPLSPYAAHIERRIYDMASWIIQGGQGAFLGMFENTSEGVDMMEFLVQQFPNGELADDALLLVADHEVRARRPQDAVTHLQDLLDRYPGSEWAREARLRIARAYREMNRGSRYDADALKRARANYLAYVADVTSTPVLAGEYAAQAEAARAELAEVEELLAQKGLEAADYYLYQGKPDAARNELTNVVRTWPGTRGATEARRRLGIEGNK